MFTIEELRELRDKYTEIGVPERDLLSRLVYSHLDASHRIEQLEAQVSREKGKIARLQEALTAVKNRVEVALS